MKIIKRTEIEAVLTKDAVIEVVRDAFIAHSQGEIDSPPPMHMTYNNDLGERIGDCHVKAAHSKQHPVIAIKLAIGFYENPKIDLPVNNGLVMLLSRETGEPKTLLLDEGLLTTYRTAAAGAIAASLVETKKTDVLGIVGTGNQAFQQTAWTCHHLGIKTVMVFGRSIEKADLLVKKLQSKNLQASRADSSTELCAASRIVITTTPASEPIVMSSDVSSPTHFVAMGADTHGKQELDTELLARADVLIVDDKTQCLDHGDTAAAHNAGLINSHTLQSLGAALSNQLSISSGISVVDLTGLGAQDLAIASLVA